MYGYLDTQTQIKVIFDNRTEFKKKFIPYLKTLVWSMFPQLIKCMTMILW